MDRFHNQSSLSLFAVAKVKYPYQITKFRAFFFLYPRCDALQRNVVASSYSSDPVDLNERRLLQIAEPPVCS